MEKSHMKRVEQDKGVALPEIILQVVNLLYHNITTTVTKYLDFTCNLMI